MNRVVLVCEGVPSERGAETALDIEAEFRNHRRWHQNVSCEWDGSRLVLAAENDYDPNGQALLDEFSDALSAYVRGGFDGEIKLISAERHDT